jgi:hypothetical protein
MDIKNIKKKIAERIKIEFNSEVKKKAIEVLRTEYNCSERKTRDAIRLKYGSFTALSVIEMVNGKDSYEVLFDYTEDTIESYPIEDVVADVVAINIIPKRN